MAPSPRTHRLLVVDDSAFQRDFLAETLRQNGFHVTTAEDGVEALNKIYQDSPDAVVSDVTMPELTGFQLCRILKNDPGTAGIPVVMLTSLSQQQDRFWGTQAGADRYLVKGETIEHIVKVIHEVLEESRGKTKAPFRSFEPAQGGFTASAAKQRVGLILDNLLFEATISNRVRGLFRYSPDTSSLARELFDFLHEVLRFELGALVVRNPRSLNLHLDLGKSVSVADGKLAAWAAGAEWLAGVDERRVSWHTRGGGASTETPVASFESRMTLPLKIGDETPGILIMMEPAAGHYGEEDRRTIQVVRRELGALLKYLATLDEMETVKSDFTSMLVHDLRSPLSGILAGADLLADSRTAKLSRDQGEIVEIIKSSGRKLLGLVNDILDVRKIEAGRLSLNRRDVNPGALLEHMKGATNFLAREKGIVLETVVEGDPPAISVDSEKLEQVLQNLLSNAVKFTPAGGKITMRAQAAGSGVRFEVVDSGSGIKPEERERLFRKYTEVSGTRRSETMKSTGLGLFICKSIVEAHGGTIGVDSTPGAGATFWFVIPGG